MTENSTKYGELHVVALVVVKCPRLKQMIRSGLARLWQAWSSTQVECHGSYSTERVLRLETYMSSLSVARLLFICLVIPLPSLALAALIEAAPLAAPEEDIRANWVFWIRFWVTSCFVDWCIVLLLGEYVSRLDVKSSHVVLIGSLAGTASTVVVFVLASVTVFPLPFSALVGSPPTIVVTTMCFSFGWHDQWKTSASFRHEILRRVAVLMNASLLTIIYPLYILGFVSLKGVNQALFAIVLPVIKPNGKNLITVNLEDEHDVKPQIVVFSVEVFNGLYVSSALQNASPFKSTATIMILNFVQFWLSTYDVVQILADVQKLMHKIPRDHQAANLNFVRVARILQKTSTTNSSRNESMIVVKRIGVKAKSSPTNDDASKVLRIVPAAIDRPRRQSKRRNTQNVALARLFADSVRKARMRIFDAGLLPSC